MSLFKKIINNLPEVQGPDQKNLPFKEKMKWTLIVLLMFFLLGVFPLFGLGQNRLAQLETLSIILGAEFGSIISLGIGPIVTASIVLQLLNGAGILKLNLRETEGKRTFQGLQKLLTLGFIIFEAIIYVLMGGLAPADALLANPALYANVQLVLIFQLILGGIMILFMDEIVSKWGFGSGVGLFIAAGVSKSIMLQAFNWQPGASALSGAAQGFTYSSGAVPQLFQALAAGDPTTASLMVGAIIATIVVFCIVVFVQSMKVEIPLSFGMVRGYGVRWPLSFLYTSVIPVILVSALIANLQLFGRFLANVGTPFLGTFSPNGVPQSGFVYWLQGPNIVREMITQQTLFIGVDPYLQVLCYLTVLMIGAMVFSIFWMQTAGMDARSQAKNMMSSGLQIPGFRRDERVLERLLSRYIWPLTVMGGLAIGFLSGFADVTGTLSSGTGILLAVMIIYKLYEEIAQKHMMDMNPMMRKFMGG